MMWIGSYIMDTLESDVLFLRKGIAQITRNAMLVYPYIKSGVMSHGKAAEMLGLHKIELIALYGKLGLPYFDETEEEFEEDLAVLKRLRGATI